MLRRFVHAGDVIGSDTANRNALECTVNQDKWKFIEGKAENCLIIHFVNGRKDQKSLHTGNTHCTDGHGLVR